MNAIVVLVVAMLGLSGERGPHPGELGRASGVRANPATASATSRDAIFPRTRAAAEAPPVAARADPSAASAHGPLLMPVRGIEPSALIDTFTQARSGGRVHDAIDIMAPAGTPVVAAVDGRVAKLFTSAAGGITLYQFDVAERQVYYYAHLAGYAPGIAEGRVLRRGEVIGYVGSTGNANAAAPHLHFAVHVLGPEKRWWQGKAINPYPLLVGEQLAGRAPR